MKSLCFFIVTVATIFALASERSICNRTPWNDTICCIGKPGKEPTVDGGAENALSCESSLQSLNDSDVMITLVWDSNKLTTGHPPSRLHLFSYCINPTNTSVGLSLSTVVYNYVRFRHTSSTIISQSLNSRCSYFGCYEAYYGFYYYTFSEVSCTDPGHAYSGGPLIMTTTSVLSTSMQTSLFRSSLQTTDYIYYTMTSVVYVTQSPFPSKAFTPTLTGTYVGAWAWFISVIVVVVLSLIVITTYLVVDRCCTKRNLQMSDISATWLSQQWTTQVAFPEEKFLIHEIMSLHSVHTQYEEMSALDSPVEQKCS